MDRVYRFTLPGKYDPGTPGHVNVGCRQGYYAEAPDWRAARHLAAVHLAQAEVPKGKPTTALIYAFTLALAVDTRDGGSWSTPDDDLAAGCPNCRSRNTADQGSLMAECHDCGAGWRKRA